ncbi:MAG: hypothetical protein LC725_12945, partial [Lentisphaerae bacterium]|nr:hypothetical protein [Lentisphaerota bacterium]
MLDGWNAARLPGPDYLSALREQVPEQVQLTRLTLQQSLDRPKPAVPTRRRGRGPPPPPSPTYSRWIGNVYLGGTAVGSNADANVRRMDNAFKTLPFFKDLFARVEVKRFTADQESLADDVRVFDIECGFQPRPIRSGS